MKKTAIILAGGSGTRMGMEIPKQYIEYKGKPILYYTIKTFEDSIVDEIILVIRKGDYDRCLNQIINKYKFKKVRSIVYGGAERYLSVKAGLDAINLTNQSVEHEAYNSINYVANNETEYLKQDGIVFIHDGARPCISSRVIERCYENVLKYKACIAAVPVKDTIKVVDKDGFAVTTPDRDTLWQVQTPQVFDVKLIKQAYDNMFSSPVKCNITDDAMIVEKYTDYKVKIVEGSYNNIKITTKEDLDMLASIMP